MVINRENIIEKIKNFIDVNYKNISRGMNVYIHSKDFDFSYHVGSIPELNFEYTEDTIYDLASLTKSLITAPLIMKYVEKGVIGLNDDLETLGLYESREPISKVTVRELITHRSGLISTYPLYRFGKTKSDYLRTISLLYSKKNDEQREVYSDLNYILLGFILENITGKSLDKLSREELLEPISMKNTDFNPKFNKNRIAPTEKDDSRGGILWGKVHDENAYYLDGVAGHAGLFSNAKDISRYIDALLSGKILNKRTLEIMISPQNTDIGGIFGIGWMVKTPLPINPSPSFGYSAFFGDIAPDGTFGHTGFTGTSICIEPLSGIYIIILSNRVYPTRENNGIIRFRRLFHNLVFSLLL